MKESKSILLLTPHLKLKGGVSNFYNQILPYLKSEAKIEIIQVGTQFKGNIIKTIMDYFRVIHKLPHIDIVHINASLNIKSFIRDGIFTIIAKLFRKKIVLSIHGWDNKLWHKIKMKKNPYYMWSIIMMKSDVIITVSKFQKENILSLFPQYKNKIIVIPPPIPKHLFKWEPRSKIISNALNILFFGRLIKEKGVFTTIETSILLNKKGYPIKLFIGGSCAKEMENTIKKIISQYEWIHFVPNPTEEEKIELYKKSHIYCFPSTYPEGLPATILESMAAGNVVITYPLKGIRDFSSSNIIIAHNKEEIITIIEKLIDHKDKLIRMMVENKEQVKDLEAENLSDKLLSIYNNI